MSKFAFVLLMVSLLAPTPALADGKECPLPDHLKQRGYDCNSVGDFGDPQPLRHEVKRRLIESVPYKLPAKRPAKKSSSAQNKSK